jgi:hypothetical protein
MFPMTGRIALLLLFACMPAAASGETASERAARFYADGLELPLLQMRNGMMLVQTCEKRLRRGCDKQQRELVANDRTLQLLDEFTLFPQRPAQDPATGIGNARQLRQMISETSAALLLTSSEYDQSLFARFGASLRACPDENELLTRKSLEELVRLNLSGFQSLAGESLAAATEAISRDEELIAGRLRQSPEDCIAARRLGEHLMQLMHSKLQPWSGEKQRVESAANAFQFGAPKVVELTASEKRQEDRELAHAVAGNFVMVVATELQLTAYPDSESRIRAVTDATER